MLVGMGQFKEYLETHDAFRGVKRPGGTVLERLNETNSCLRMII